MAYKAKVNRGPQNLGRGQWGRRLGPGGVPGTTGMVFGPGPQNLGRGNLMQGLGSGGKPTPAASAGGSTASIPHPGEAGPTATPMDPRITAWQNEQNTALSGQRDTALTGLTADANRAASDYGFNITNDAAGNPVFGGDLTVNPQDPFSKMALLQKSYEGQKRGSLNSYAAQGQLYSGALHNKQTSDLSHNNQDKDALAKAFQDLLASIRQQRAGVTDSYNAGVGSAGAQAIQMALGG